MKRLIVFTLIFFLVGIGFSQTPSTNQRTLKVNKGQTFKANFTGYFLPTGTLKMYLKSHQKLPMMIQLLTHKTNELSLIRQEKDMYKGGVEWADTQVVKLREYLNKDMEERMSRNKWKNIERFTLVVGGVVIGVSLTIAVYKIIEASK